MSAVKVTFKDPDNGNHQFEIWINDRFAYLLPMQTAIEMLDIVQYACFQAGQMEFFMDTERLRQ
jgi:hypothetical protein